MFNLSLLPPKDFRLFSYLYNFFNKLGLKYLKKFWVLPHIFSPYPGIIAHFKYKNLEKKFHKFTVVEGKQASDFFESIGVTSFARNHEGVCTFYLNKTLCIYQVTNKPLIKDEVLSPSTGPNQELFGDFMGTYPHNDKLRRQKRQILMRSIANPSFLEQKRSDIEIIIEDILSLNKDKSLALEDFCMQIVSHIDSFLPGVLDFRNKSLNYYLESEEYSETLKTFFDLASNVISKLDPETLKKVNSIVPFVKDIISNNYEEINSAEESNIIKQYFKLMNTPFEKQLLTSLPDSFYKELGTIIVAIYDTTSLSLYWAITYIETNTEIKQKLLDMIDKPSTDGCSFSYIELVVLEAIRLGGSNPTALWRELLYPLEISINKQLIYLPKGVKFWLDRKAANRDDGIFPEPLKFCPNNIKAITEKEDTIFTLLNNDRYEINSFSMVNTDNNPRKCPGRFFSILIQTCILYKLYKSYEITTKNLSTDMRLYSAMPKPKTPGTIIIRTKFVDLMSDTAQYYAQAPEAVS